MMPAIIPLDELLLTRVCSQWTSAEEDPTYTPTLSGRYTPGVRLHQVGI